MSEALELGIHRRVLYELRDCGIIELVSRGLYHLKEGPELAMPDLVTVAKRVPSGVICLISALSFHELTSQIPHFVYLAIPRNASRPQIDYPPLRCFWYPDSLMALGVEQGKVDHFGIKMFDREKTLIDCIRLRKRIGVGIAVEALKLYVQRSDTDINRLIDYSQIARVDHVLRPMLEVILGE